MIKFPNHKYRNQYCGKTKFNYLFICSIGSKKYKRIILNKYTLENQNGKDKKISAVIIKDKSEKI